MQNIKPPEKRKKERVCGLFENPYDSGCYTESEVLRRYERGRRNTSPPDFEENNSENIIKRRMSDKSSSENSLFACRTSAPLLSCVGEVRTKGMANKFSNKSQHKIIGLEEDNVSIENDLLNKNCESSSLKKHRKVSVTLTSDASSLLDELITEELNASKTGCLLGDNKQCKLVSDRLRKLTDLSTHKNQQGICKDLSRNHETEGQTSQKLHFTEKESIHEPIQINGHNIKDNEFGRNISGNFEFNLSIENNLSYENCEPSSSRKHKKVSVTLRSDASSMLDGIITEELNASNNSLPEDNKQCKLILGRLRKLNDLPTCRNQQGIYKDSSRNNEMEDGQTSQKLHNTGKESVHEAIQINNYNLKDNDFGPNISGKFDFNVSIENNFSIKNCKPSSLRKHRKVSVTLRDDASSLLDGIITNELNASKTGCFLVDNKQCKLVSDRLRKLTDLSTHKNQQGICKDLSRNHEIEDGQTGQKLHNTEKESVYEPIQINNHSIKDNEFGINISGKFNLSDYSIATRQIRQSNSITEHTSSITDETQECTQELECDYMSEIHENVSVDEKSSTECASQFEYKNKDDAINHSKIIDTISTSIPLINEEEASLNARDKENITLSSEFETETNCTNTIGDSKQDNTQDQTTHIHCIPQQLREDIVIKNSNYCFITDTNIDSLRFHDGSSNIAECIDLCDSCQKPSFMHSFQERCVCIGKIEESRDSFSSFNTSLSRCSTPQSKSSGARMQSYHSTPMKTSRKKLVKTSQETNQVNVKRAQMTNKQKNKKPKSSKTDRKKSLDMRVDKNAAEGTSYSKRRTDHALKLTKHDTISEKSNLHKDKNDEVEASTSKMDVDPLYGAKSDNAFVESSTPESNKVSTPKSNKNSSLSSCNYCKDFLNVISSRIKNLMVSGSHDLRADSSDSTKFKIPS